LVTTFFAGRFPFVDLESGGSVEGLVKNIGELIAKIPADAKLIPGHGPISTLDDLKSYHRMLQQTTEIVRGKIKVGKTLDQIKTEGLPAEWGAMGHRLHQNRSLGRDDLQEPHREE
jgi:glyoxylase-like metal-dependent hydrolase (beta-lactamase superfamily II)